MRNRQTLSDSDIVRRPQPVYKILEILPYELVEVVVSHVTDIETLRSLALTNKLFQELAEARIYRDAFISNGAQASRLAKALKRKPGRASLVRHLQNACRFQSFEGLLELDEIVPQMTRLETLVVETPDCNAWHPEDRIPWITQQKAYYHIFEATHQPKNNILPNLLSCTLHFVDEHHSLYALEHYSIIFLHPTLTDLTISCAHIDPPRELHPALLAPSLTNTTPLTTLNLIECDFHPQGLYHLLSLPRQLISLNITEAMHLDLYTHHRRYSGLSHPEILHPIHVYQPFLARLRIGRLRTRQDRLFSLFPLNLAPFTQLSAIEFPHIHIRRTFLDSSRMPDYCDPIHRLGYPAFNTGGPQTTSLTYSDIGLEYWTPGLKFFTCAFRNKVSHGIENLKTLRLVLVDDELEIEGLFRTDGIVERRQALRRQRMEKVRREVRELGKLGRKESVGIRVVLDWVRPNNGTIPPYLVGEYVPEIRPEYDSEIEEVGNGDG